MKKEVLAVLPSNIRWIIQQVNKEILEQIEEIRIRENRPLEIIYSNHYRFLTKTGEVTSQIDHAYIPTHEEMFKMVNLISNHSIYRLEEELKRGYITIHGGHRIGIAGKAVLEKGEVKTLKHISSLNIRIAKEIIGAADAVIPLMINISKNELYNTLIVSPPQSGKTTLIRDIARQVSSGFSGFTGKKVGIIDERSEIAGCVQGVPQHDVGVRTDVLDACPKAEGMMMMIRSMSPDLIIVDEIGRQEDAAAILEARNAGVKVIATAHGNSLTEIAKRPSLSRLIQQQIFSRYILLSRNNGPGTIDQILDQNLAPLKAKGKRYA